MTPERVTYQKTFNLGSYQSERIGVDMLLDATDSPEEALLKCKAMVESFHIETIPIQPPEIVQIASTPEDESRIAFIQTLNMCSKLKMLERFKPQVDRKGDPEITDLYNLKHKELSK